MPKIQFQSMPIKGITDGFDEAYYVEQKTLCPGAYGYIACQGDTWYYYLESQKTWVKIGENKEFAAQLCIERSVDDSQEIEAQQEYNAEIAANNCL